MRKDANLIAFRVGTAVLKAQHSFSFEVGGRRVECTATPVPGDGVWLKEKFCELDPATAGPWPSEVKVRCDWQVGAVTLRVRLYPVRRGNKDGTVALRVELENSLLLSTELATGVGDLPDGGTAHVTGSASFGKRKSGSGDFNQKAKALLREQLQATRWPFLTDSEFVIFRFTVGADPVIDDAREAFERTVQATLLKMDLISGGAAAVARRAPLIEEAARLHAQCYSGVGADEDDTEEEDSEEVEPTKAVEERQPAPLNLIYYGPPGTGKTYRLWQDFLKDGKPHEFVTFHQSFSYEDFLEGIRPRLKPPAPGGTALDYEIRDGVFLKAAHEALRLAFEKNGFNGTPEDFHGLPRDRRTEILRDAPPYVVLIDEINRGNVSRIFGELITLLEPDKRLGAEHEVIVTLPYSGRRFGVPSNLRVIGTMNTADRSVEALDSALRRRFAFEELAPKPDLLRGWSIDGIDLESLLTAINGRLEKLRDRDHRIGHAYFLALPGGKDATLDALKEVFTKSIVPLLQEYFFGDWGKIGLVLGRDFVSTDESATSFASFDHDDSEVLAQRKTFRLKEMSELASDDFQRIYQTRP